MEWIDESRRKGFEATVRKAAGKLSIDLNHCLPDDVRQRALQIGSELILCYEDAATAIAIATERRIAVLGFDSGEILEDGFRVVNYTGYDEDIKFTGDWNLYVDAMNAEAEQWIKAHPLGKNQGYILTSTSETEFAQLQLKRSQL